MPDDQEDNSSWDTWYLHQDITYEFICAFYATADADEEDVIATYDGACTGDRQRQRRQGRRMQRQNQHNNNDGRFVSSCLVC